VPPEDLPVAALGNPDFTVDDDTLVVAQAFRLIREPRA
jgi:hypothetical protein